MNESAFEFEVKPGALLPPETRIPLPEMSYEQEIINTPVPFNNRVEFLSYYLKLKTRPMAVHEITEKLKISEYALSKMAELVGASSSEKDGHTVFEEFTLEVIQEELEWAEYSKAQDEYISAYQIATILNKGVNWVREHAYGMGVYPTTERTTPQGTIYLYPKSLIEMLRIYILHFPPANDWYSQNEAESMIGKSDSWIAKRVKQGNLTSQLRVSNTSSFIGIHYPLETINTLQKLVTEIQPAGDWLTYSRLAIELGVTRAWIDKHIKTYHHLSEMRLTDYGEEKRHYPLIVKEELHKILSKEYLPAGDWLTIWGISKKLNRTVDWVEARISTHKDSAEKRVSLAGKLEDHYPPKVVELLRVESNTYTEAGDWSTVNGMAEHLGHTSKWVSARLTPYADFQETRKSAVNNTPRKHYPPFVETALNELDLDKLNEIYTKNSTL